MVGFFVAACLSRWRRPSSTPTKPSIGRPCSASSTRTSSAYRSWSDASANVKESERPAAPKLLGLVARQSRLHAMCSAHAKGHCPKQDNSLHTFLPQTQTMLLLARTVLDPLSNCNILMSAQLMQELKKHMTWTREACWPAASNTEHRSPSHFLKQHIHTHTVCMHMYSFVSSSACSWALSTDFCHNEHGSVGRYLECHTQF